MSEPERQRATPLSMEAIDAYVRELQIGHDCTVRAPPLTVENILCKVYARFYNQRGQSPFPNGLPFALKHIPSLASIAVVQSRITARMQAAIATRPVVTIYELEREVCLAENVATYAELRLGSSLTALPFVQYFFNIHGPTEIAPVTSADFMQFLLFDQDAHALLTSGGDARDAVLAFSRRYMNGKYKCAQLGIHVQHFPWLLQFVRQEIGRTSAFFSQLQLDNLHCERNAVIYERVLTSLHAELVKKRDRAEEPARELKFVVHASALEVEGSDLPPACWGADRGPRGGLCMYGSLRAEPMLPRLNTSGMGLSIPAPKGQHTQPPSTLSSAVVSSEVPVAAMSEVGGNMGACSHARKRRRGVIVTDERKEILDVAEPLLSTLQPPFVLNESTTAIPTTSALSLAPPSFPTVPLEDVMSVLRCLAVMHSSTFALRPATCDDFAALNRHASQLLPLLGEGRDVTPGHHQNTTPASGTLFSVSVDVLLRLLSHSKAPERLYALYFALVKRSKGTEKKEEEATTVASIGRLLYECLEMGMSELIFLPLVSTHAMLPLMAAQGTLCGRVILSGRPTSSDLRVFHPLQFILDPFFDDRSCGFLAIVDSTALLRGSCESDPQRETQQLLESLEDCGVLMSVPLVWFRDGFLLGLLQSRIRRHLDGTKRTNVEESRMALRMLLLYWWLLGMWCGASENSDVAVAVEELVQGLRDTRWIPSFTRCDKYDSDNASSTTNKSGGWKLRVDGWHTPGELFPFFPCFTAHGLSDLLRFAPNNPSDVFSLLEENAGDVCFQYACDFLGKWSTIVQKNTAKIDANLVCRLMGMPVACEADVALRVLRSLRPGRRIALASLRYLLQCIAATKEEGVLCDARRCAIIPLPETRVGMKLYGDYVVGEMAACETLCWEPLPGIDEACALDRSISFIGDDLHFFLVDILGVSPVPSVATWLAAARACRKGIMAGVEVNASLTELFLRVLSCSCAAQYAHVLKKMEEQSEKRATAAQEALESVVDLVPVDSRTEYVFPLHGRWRRALEGLFFCGPYYSGLGGILLQTSAYDFNDNQDNISSNVCDDSNDVSEGHKMPLLSVLVFPQQPHHVLGAVLKKMGLLPLENCTEKIVTFGRMNAVSSAEFHRKVAHLAPRVEQFLCTHYPQYYALVHLRVRETLEHFTVLLATEATLQEVLRFQGRVYTMERTVRCCYVPQHNCLYGVDEEFVASLAADALADLFLPMMDAEVRQRVTLALQEWLQSANLCLRDTLPGDTDPTASIPPPLFSSGASGETSVSSSLDRTWQLSAVPVTRFREHFPLGRDGFGPTGRNTTTSATVGIGEGSTQTPSVAILPAGGGRHSARSLPQWRCDMFDSAYDVLREVERDRCDLDGAAEEDLGRTPSTSTASGRTVDRHKRTRRGGRSQPAGVAMVAHEQRDTADYAVAAERFVAEKLRTEVPSDVEVVWVNEHKEHGTPYDILLVRRREGSGPFSGSKEVLAYIEVKSTCTRARRDFEMSLRELLFAARFGRAYKVYRVFRASTGVTQRMHVEVLEDVVKLWHTGGLTMTGEVKVMPSPEV